MTGQVKEELLARMGELGIVVADGALAFEPMLLRAAEFLGGPAVFEFIDVDGQRQMLDLPAGALAFTFCQVLVVYVLDEDAQVEVYFSDGSVTAMPGSALDAALSAHIFRRDGCIRRLTVYTQAGL